MPSRIEPTRAVESGMNLRAPAPASPKLAAAAAVLHVDVLHAIFEHVGPRDILSALRVNRVWHEAACTRPWVAPWFGHSTQAVQHFVRNQKRAVDLMHTLQHVPKANLAELLTRQQDLRLGDVDEGLNQHRMHQVFALMPSLRVLSLSRSTKPYSKGAAVMCWAQPASLHERVRRQSVPPALWTGVLPAQLTHLDLAQFSLCCVDEHTHRPILGNNIIAGLLKQMALHPALTHITLGSVDGARLQLPKKLTHLKLTGSLRYQQGQIGASARLLAALPAGLTHLDAGDTLSLSSLPPREAWTAGLALELLSIRVTENDVAKLPRLLRPPLTHLDLTVMAAKAGYAQRHALSLPHSLRRLRLSLVHASPQMQQRLLMQLPMHLTYLSIELGEGASVAPLMAILSEMTVLCVLDLTLHPSGADHACRQIVTCLPPRCLRLHIDGISTSCREFLRQMSGGRGSSRLHIE